MFDELDDNQRRGPADLSGEESRPIATPTIASDVTGAEGPGMQNASSRTRYRSRSGSRSGSRPGSRYGDAAMSWLAMGALLAAWHMEARLDRPVASGSRLATVRDGSRFANQLWLNGVTRARSWIARAATESAAKTANAVVSASGVAVGQPDWSAIASVRTAKRWLGSRDDIESAREG